MLLNYVCAFKMTLPSYSRPTLYPASSVVMLLRSGYFPLPHDPLKSSKSTLHTITPPSPSSFNHSIYFGNRKIIQNFLKVSNSTKSVFMQKSPSFSAISHHQIQPIGFPCTRRGPFVRYPKPTWYCHLPKSRRFRNKLGTQLLRCTFQTPHRSRLETRCQTCWDHSK